MLWGVGKHIFFHVFYHAPYFAAGESSSILLYYVQLANYYGSKEPRTCCIISSSEHSGNSSVLRPTFSSCTTNLSLLASSSFSPFFLALSITWTMTQESRIRTLFDNNQDTLISMAEHYLVAEFKDLEDFPRPQKDSRIKIYILWLKDVDIQEVVQSAAGILSEHEWIILDLLTSISLV